MESSPMDLAFSIDYVDFQVCSVYLNHHRLLGHTPPAMPPPTDDASSSNSTSIRITFTNNFSEGILGILASKKRVLHWQSLLPSASNAHPYLLANSAHQYFSRNFAFYVCVGFHAADLDPVNGNAMDFQGSTAHWEINLDKFTLKRVPTLATIEDDEITNPWLAPNLV